MKIPPDGDHRAGSSGGRVPTTEKVAASDCSDAPSVSIWIHLPARHGGISPIAPTSTGYTREIARRLTVKSGGNTLKLSDNQIGDRLYAALEAIGTDEGETIRGNTALVAARQTLSLLEQGLLIAAERNSDDVSVMMNQPIVPPSE
jgi:hypothetical protein